MLSYTAYRVTEGVLEHLEIKEPHTNIAMSGNGLGLTTLAQLWAVKSKDDPKWRMEREKHELTTIPAASSTGTKTGTVRTYFPLSGKELEKITIEYFLACQR